MPFQQKHLMNGLSLTLNVSLKKFPKLLPEVLWFILFLSIYLLRIHYNALHYIKMIGTALVNINNICKAEEHVYHFHVHVSLLLHSQGFVEEYDWMTSKINDSCCANHSLKDHMHKHTYRGFVLSIHFFSWMSNKYNFYALDGWFCILHNVNKFRKYRNGTKCQQLCLSMAGWINLSFLQERCTCKHLCPTFRNTMYLFTFDVICIPVLWHTLLPVQASWLWMCTWETSVLVWEEKDAMDFM